MMIPRRHFTQEVSERVWRRARAVYSSTMASQDSASATIGRQSGDEESHATMTPDIDAGIVTFNYMATLEHTEPRCVVEFFPLSACSAVLQSRAFLAQTSTCRREIFRVKDPDRNAINGRLSALRPGVGPS